MEDGMGARVCTMTPARSNGGGSPTAEAVAQALVCDRPGCGCGGRTGEEWVTHCPAHEDHDPSLSLRDALDGRTLVYCHAGCPQDDVITALRRRELWPESWQGSCGLRLAELAQAKGLPEDFLRALGLTEGWVGSAQNREPCVDVPYMDIDGQVVAVRKRLTLQGDKRFSWRGGDKTLLYGLPRLEEAQEAGFVILVEGESDCWSLWYADLPALGVPGASTWRTDWARELRGIEAVYVWCEPDTGGARLVERVAQDIPSLRVIRAPTEAKDPNDLWLHLGRDRDAFGGSIKALLEAARPAAELRAQELTQEALEALDMARPLLEDPGLLDRIIDAMGQQGYAGDHRPAVLAYVAITSRLLPRPLNLALVAPSAAGKNRTVDAALALMPGTAFYSISASSPRALVYTDADLQHRTVVIAEADSIPDDGPAASALRSLAEDNVMSYEVVEKDETGHFHTRRIEKLGPTGLITTSTKPVAGQMGTRMLEVPISDTPDQTRHVLRIHAAIVNRALPDVDVTAFRAVQRWLELAGDRDVVIPFAERLADLVPDDQVRMRRDFRQLLTVIQAVALLHQCRRSHDEEGRIIATLEDYRIACDLLLDVFTAVATGGVTRTVRETVEAVLELYRGQPLTKKAIADKLNLGPTTTWYRVKSALAKGYLVNEETRKGHPARIVPGDPLPENRPALPEADALEGWMSDDLAKSTRTVEPSAQEGPTAYLEPPRGAVQEEVQRPVEPPFEISWETPVDTKMARRGATVQRFNRHRRGLSTRHRRGVSTPLAPCPHRPPGEVERRWADGIGERDPRTCVCCGAPVLPDLWVDELCPICRRGQPAKEGLIAYMWRTAMDLGPKK